MDVFALYPSVPHEEGLEAFEKSMNKRPDKTVPTNYLVMLMKLVLTMNTFEWDKKLFLQMSGTAIGTRAAPTFCGLYMGHLEEELLATWKSLLPESEPEDWCRFIEMKEGFYNRN